jgi:hypothetical protein
MSDLITILFAGILELLAWLAGVVDTCVLTHRENLERTRPVADRRMAPPEVRDVGAGFHLVLFTQYWLQFLWGRSEGGTPLAEVCLSQH